VQPPAPLPAPKGSPAWPFAVGGPTTGSERRDPAAEPTGSKIVNVPPVSGFSPEAIGSSQRFSVTGCDARASGIPPGPISCPVVVGGTKRRSLVNGQVVGAAVALAGAGVIGG